jgi:hypothetical protein
MFAADSGIEIDLVSCSHTHLPAPPKALALGHFTLKIVGEKSPKITESS